MNRRTLPTPQLGISPSNGTAEDNPTNDFVSLKRNHEFCNNFTQPNFALGHSVADMFDPFKQMN